MMNKAKEKFYVELENYINSLTEKNEMKILNFVIENNQKITDELLEFIVLKSGIMRITLENCVKFYPKFKKNYENIKNVVVCKGINCGQNRELHSKILEYALKNQGIIVEEKRCLGRCKKSPVVKVDTDIIEVATLKKIIEKLR